MHAHPSAEDNLNVSLKDITVTQRDGRITQLDQVYIRGPMIRFYIVPDMLANAPMWVSNGPSILCCPCITLTLLIILLARWVSASCSPTGSRGSVQTP